MAATLIDKLRAKRSDHDSEYEWHRFLLDAYTGCGGFAGKVKPPAVGYLGWAAEVYNTSNLAVWGRGLSTYETYLDRFHREDEDKFRARVNVAHFVNYTQPIADLYASYLSGNPPTRQGVDEGSDLDEWMQDADGRGQTWDEVRSALVIPRTLQLGWIPVLVDVDPGASGDEKPVSKAAEREAGVRPRVIPLFPAHVLDWDTDESGALRWVKLRLPETDKSDPLGEPKSFERILIYTAQAVSEYRIEKAGRGKEVATVVYEDKPHNFGEVPIVIFRASRTPDDAVRGISLIGGVATENRRHFNAQSEFDEHLRGQVFAMLEIPVPAGQTQPSELKVGNGQGLTVPADARRGHAFIAPPASVAETYEKRLAASAREIYRIANAPFDGESGGAQSGLSRAYQFDGTNKRLVKMARELAMAEERLLYLVAIATGANHEDADQIRVAPPADFRVDDLSVDIENTVKAVELAGMSPTAKMLMMHRAAERMVPNAHQDDRKRMREEFGRIRDREVAKLDEPEPEPPATPTTTPPANDAEPPQPDDAPPAEPQDVAA